MDLREMMKNAGDIGRLVQKLTLRKGAIDDLVTVKKTIELWAAISARLQLERKMENEARQPSENWDTIDHLTNKLSDLSRVAIRIEEALQQEGAEDVDVEDVEEMGNETEATEEPSGATKWHISHEYVYCSITSLLASHTS
jgi:DNA mismatch repair ATPase MutS